MISTEIYGKIRKCRIEGMSQRDTAGKLGVSRITVAKYWDGQQIPGANEYCDPKGNPTKEDVKKAMRQYCKDHENNQTNKQKINAHILWRDLRHEYPRSEATYRRYWIEIQGESQIQTRLPLLFRMAEAAEVDWKHAKVRIRGREITLHILCVNLMYAYTPFMKAYTNEKQYNLIDGLVSAMDFYSGAPRKLIMDNMTTARKKGYGKEAELTDEFKLFAAHFGMEIVFTNPREAPEKGAVEVAAKTAGGILTPIPDVNDISEVNDRLLGHCLYYIAHTGPVGNRPRSVKKMTEEEKPFLTPLPIKRYEVGVHGSASVNNQQLFKFDEHLFSVPRPYAGRQIGIIAYSYRVEMYYKGHRVWQCDRPLFEDENRVYAEHYLFDLKIKPRSRENAFPLLEGILPDELYRFRKLCKSKTTKCYQLYMLMQKMEEVGRESLLNAVALVNDAGNPTYQKVEEILLLNLKPKDGETDLLDQAVLDDEFYVEQRDLAGYDVLVAINKKEET